MHLPLLFALAIQCPDGTPPPCRGSTRPAPAAAPNTIAVLYLDNLSRDTGDVYLAEGLTEELMSRLGEVAALQVKSRTAVRRLRARAASDAVAAGRELGVAHLVSGSVLRQRDRLRVTIELTRVATGNRVWGRSFDRGADDLLATQAEIAESVAINVGARLAPAESRRLLAQPTRNPAAWDQLLRGRYAASRRTAASLMSAVRHFEAALRLDPSLTSALVRASAAYTQLGSFYYRPEIGIPRETLALRGRELLDRAMREDSTSVEAILAWAIVRPASVNIGPLRRAVALEPRNPEAHHSLGLSLRILRDDSGAVAAFRRAIALEPDRAITLQNLGQTYMMGRRYAEAARWHDSALATRPDAAFYYMSRALTALLMDDTATARALAPQIAATGSAHGAEEVLALVEVRAGDTASARARMLRADSMLAGRECFVSHECLELVAGLAVVGLTDRALTVFESLTPRDGWLAYWSGRPELDVLRRNARFQRVVQEAGNRIR